MQPKINKLQDDLLEVMSKILEKAKEDPSEVDASILKEIRTTIDLWNGNGKKIPIGPTEEVARDASKAPYRSTNVSTAAVR